MKNSNLTYRLYNCKLHLPISSILFALLHFASYAQTSAEEIAKQLNNPVPSLISLPFQNNLQTKIGPLKGYQNTMNVEPVIPFNLTKSWNLITRVVLPVIAQNNVTADPSRQTGLSEAVVSAFFFPTQVNGGLIWGAGSAFLLPTATNSILGTRKRGVGPTTCMLFQESGWTHGILVNQIWSYAGSSYSDKVSQFYALPILNYNWASGAGLGVTADVTRDWQHHYTTAVITPAIFGLTRIGKQNSQIQAGPMIPVSAASGQSRISA